MTTDAHWTERLSEYLDGEMGERDRKSLEAHVAGCSECAVILDELRAVVAEAGTLPDPTVSEELKSELWAGIAPRLQPRRPWYAGLLEIFAPAPGAGRRFSLSVPQLAGAALAIALVSAGSAWWIGGRNVATPQAGAPVATAPRQAGANPAAMPAGFDAPRYTAAVEDLERTFEAHRSELDPETVRVVEENLAIIDQAVEQARRALLADPANPYLNGHLAAQMRWKLRVLQQATMTLAANG